MQADALIPAVLFLYQGIKKPHVPKLKHAAEFVSDRFKLNLIIPLDIRR